MNRIAVDVGNSSIKAGWVSPQPGVWTTIHRWTRPDEFRHEPPEPATWLIASVNRPRCRQLTEWIETHRRQDRIYLLDWTDVPLRVDVDEPSLVGMDRLCAAVAAHGRAGDRPCVVVDAGTAITIDGVSRDGSFVGGSIFVGLRGAFDQLSQSTDALPRLEIPSAADRLSPFGKSTAEAIRSGTILSTAGGISKIVGDMQRELGKAALVLVTGGSARLLGPWLDFEFLWVEHLVLDGIVSAGARRLNSHESLDR